MIFYGLACFTAGVLSLVGAQLLAVRFLMHWSLNPMGALSLLKLISPSGWAAIAFVAMTVFAGVQTLRLEHAKADQFDRTACVRGQACRPPKWKAEVEQLRPQLAGAQRDLGQCRQNEGALQASLNDQNAQVTRWQAAAASAQAESAKALAAASTAAAASDKRVAQILAAKPGADACKSADDLIMGSLSR